MATGFPNVQQAIPLLNLAVAPWTQRQRIGAEHNGKSLVALPRGSYDF